MGSKCFKSKAASRGHDDDVPNNKRAKKAGKYALDGQANQGFAQEASSRQSAGDGGGGGEFTDLSAVTTDSGGRIIHVPGSDQVRIELANGPNHERPIVVIGYNSDAVAAVEPAVIQDHFQLRRRADSSASSGSHRSAKSDKSADTAESVKSTKSDKSAKSHSSKSSRSSSDASEKLDSVINVADKHETEVLEKELGRGQLVTEEDEAYVATPSPFGSLFPAFHFKNDGQGVEADREIGEIILTKMSSHKMKSERRGSRRRMSNTDRRKMDDNEILTKLNNSPNNGNAILLKGCEYPQCSRTSIGIDTLSYCSMHFCQLYKNHRIDIDRQGYAFENETVGLDSMFNVAGSVCGGDESPRSAGSNGLYPTRLFENSAQHDGIYTSQRQRNPIHKPKFKDNSNGGRSRDAPYASTDRQLTPVAHNGPATRGFRRRTSTRSSLSSKVETRSSSTLRVDNSLLQSPTNTASTVDGRETYMKDVYPNSNTPPRQPQHLFIEPQTVQPAYASLIQEPSMPVHYNSEARINTRSTSALSSPEEEYGYEKCTNRDFVQDETPVKTVNKIQHENRDAHARTPHLEEAHLDSLGAPNTQNLSAHRQHLSAGARTSCSGNTWSIERWS